MKVMPLPSNREASEIEMILFLENLSASKEKKNDENFVAVASLLPTLRYT
jgi:hypothetical protein